MKEQLKKKYAAYSDEDLQGILAGGLDNYSQEALNAATELLILRGYEIQYEEEEDQSSGGKPSLWFGGLIVGILFLGMIWYGNKDKLVAGNDKVQVHISNLSEEALSLEINGELVEVGPEAIVPMKMDEGANTVKFDGEIKAINLKKGQNYLLNPVGGIYYLEEFVYSASSLLEAPNFKKIKPTIFFVDEIPVYGAYKKDSSYLITGWDYGIGQSPPSSLRVQYNQDISKIKLYNKIEFLQKQTEINPVMKQKIFLEEIGIDSKREIEVQKESAYHSWRNQFMQKSAEDFGLTSPTDKEELLFVCIEMNVDGKTMTYVADRTKHSYLYTNTGEKKMVLLDVEERGSQNYHRQIKHTISTSKKHMREVGNFSLPEKGRINYHYKTTKNQYSMDGETFDKMFESLEKFSNRERLEHVFLMSKYAIEQVIDEI